MSRPLPEDAPARPAAAEQARAEAPEATADATAIARQGETCWRRERSERAAFLIDGQAYFSALRSALIKAERSVFIIGWEFHTQILLEPGRPAEGALEDGWPNRLYDLLRALTRRKKGLEVRILLWDFAMVYLLEREILPLFQPPWRSSRHIHFRMDNRHPTGASHHQKLVVIDDRLAFVGGLDITGGRWDTPEHAADDARRKTPSGSPYQPFHDVQMVVDGPAAARLGELARQRWERATGHALRPADRGGDPWPDGVRPDLVEAQVAIARTEASYGDQPEVREVEALYVASIAAARHSIYIENQYFTSVRVGDAIEESLQRDQGPEIVMVGPRNCGGWLEEATMGLGRARLLQRLRAADRHGRFAAYYPALPDLRPGRFLTVHAKVMVVDDRLVHVGSSNLANRSMGLDTECDLAVEAEGRADLAAAIVGLRDRLLAEHLGCEPEAVQRATRSEGSLIGAIERLRGAGRSLEPLSDEMPELVDLVAPDTEVVDPESPISAETLAAQMLDLPDDEDGESRAAGAPPGGLSRKVRRVPRRAWLFGGLALLAALLAVTWNLTPLAEYAEPARLLSWAAAWRDNALSPLLVLGLFLLGGVIVFPVVVLLSATGIVFGPFLGFVYGLAGCVASAAFLFGLGSWLGRDAVRRLGGLHVNRISRELGRHGVKAVILLRLLPVAPFSIVNLVAGASHIGFRDFLLGTLAGMAPGSLALVIFGDGLVGLLRAPSLSAVALLAGAILLILTAAYLGRHWARHWARRWVTRRGSGKAGARGRQSS